MRSESVLSLPRQYLDFVESAVLSCMATCTVCGIFMYRTFSCTDYVRYLGDSCQAECATMWQRLRFVRRYFKVTPNRASKSEHERIFAKDLGSALDVLLIYIGNGTLFADPARIEACFHVHLRSSPGWETPLRYARQWVPSCFASKGMQGNGTTLRFAGSLSFLLSVRVFVSTSLEVARMYAARARARFAVALRSIPSPRFARIRATCRTRFLICAEFFSSCSFLKYAYLTHLSPFVYIYDISSYQILSDIFFLKFLFIINSKYWSTSIISTYFLQKSWKIYIS